MFADAGFQIGMFVLSGPFFGIPQTRTRAFFVAIKSGRSYIKNGILATHAVLPTPKSNTRWSPSFLKVTQDLKANCNGTKEWLEKRQSTSLGLKAPVSVYDCLKHLVDADLRKSTGHFVKDSITANTRNNHADNNNGNDSQNVCRKPDNTLPKNYYSPTILASGPKSAGKGETGGSLWHFYHNRTPTIREASLLMGFNSDFQFRTAVNTNAIGTAAEFDAFWRMMGNAVIPPVAKAIGSAILKELEKDSGIQDEILSSLSRYERG